ncbi:MAG TPA: flagellin [Phenylobacterium sp.]|jgi:flagellin
MPANSVNTNASALVALQNLNQTNMELNTTQTRINTGKRISNAKDNGAIWAIAQNQRATSKALDAVRESLQRGQSTVDVAISAGETVSDLLLQMKEKALAAADASLDTTSRQALNADFIALRDQLAKAVSTADFNGVNMVKSGGASIASLANADATAKITVLAQNLSLGGGIVTVAAAGSIGTIGVATSMIATVNTSISNVSTALSKLGTGSKALASHQNFINKLQDSIDIGVGNLVDADLAKESAKLQALQTKQQLGVQALSIANQSSSILLGLFR